VAASSASLGCPTLLRWGDGAGRSGGGGLLLMPTAPVFKEKLFLARHDIEDERVSGERASIPSKALEVATGIASIGREQHLVGVGAATSSGSRFTMQGTTTRRSLRAP